MRRRAVSTTGEAPRAIVAGQTYDAARRDTNRPKTAPRYKPERPKWLGGLFWGLLLVLCGFCLLDLRIVLFDLFAHLVRNFRFRRRGDRSPTTYVHPHSGQQKNRNTAFHEHCSGVKTFGNRSGESDTLAIVGQADPSKDF